MQSIVLVIHLLIVLALIGVVLLQRSEGGGLGMGGGGASGGLVSVRGTANMLSRATAILAAVFFVTSITLAILASNRDEARSILDDTPAATSAPATPADQPEPAQPGVPLSQ